MTGSIRRVAMVSMHTSPVEQPGVSDAGGLNTSVLALASELAIRGISVALVTRASGRSARTELDARVTLFELEAGPVGPVSKQGMGEITDDFGESVAALARAEKFDVFHTHYWLSGIAVLPVALELGVPLVQSFHTLATMKNSALGTELEPPFRVHGEAFLASQADAIVAASSAEATAVIDHASAPPGHVWIVPPGVDLTLFAPATRSQVVRTLAGLGVDSTRPIVALAGRIQPLKGHELAVRAIAEIKHSRGWAPVLVVVGNATPGDEGYLEWLRALSIELGVGSDVMFLNAVSRTTLAELLSAASVTLMPSFSETFGLVALESAACGTPVMGYRRSGLSESIKDGVSGVLLDSREVRSWATELAELIEDENRLKHLAITARKFATEFSWGLAATRLLKVYETVARP